MRAHTHTCSGHLCLQVRLCACARVRAHRHACTLTHAHAHAHPIAPSSVAGLRLVPGVTLKDIFPPFWGLELFPDAGLLASLPESRRRWAAVGPSPFLGFYSSGLARERRPGPGRRLPLGLRASASVSPMAAPLPSGLQAGRLGAFWDQASSLPAPQRLISRFMAPGQRRGACSLDVGRFLLASPAR